MELRVKTKSPSKLLILDLVAKYLKIRLDLTSWNRIKNKTKEKIAMWNSSWLFTISVGRLLILAQRSLKKRGTWPGLRTYGLWESFFSMWSLACFLSKMWMKNLISIIQPTTRLVYLGWSCQAHWFWWLKKCWRMILWADRPWSSCWNSPGCILNFEECFIFIF